MLIYIALFQNLIKVLSVKKLKGMTLILRGFFYTKVQDCIYCIVLEKMHGTFEW